jgi:hypothetical protein
VLDVFNAFSMLLVVQMISAGGRAARQVTAFDVPLPLRRIVPDLIATPLGARRSVLNIGTVQRGSSARERHGYRARRAHAGINDLNGAQRRR